MLTKLMQIMPLFVKNFIMIFLTVSMLIMFIMRSLDQKNRWPVIGLRHFFKKLNLKHRHQDLPYSVLVPKFHNNSVKFRKITLDFWSYPEADNKEFVNILEHFNKVLSENPICIIKNSFELTNKLNTISNIKQTHIFDFKDL